MRFRDNCVFVRINVSREHTIRQLFEYGTDRIQQTFVDESQHGMHVYSENNGNRYAQRRTANLYDSERIYGIVYEAHVDSLSGIRFHLCICCAFVARRRTNDYNT